MHECLCLKNELELIDCSDEVNCVSAAAKEGDEKTFRVFSGSDDEFARFWDVSVPAEGGVREVGRGIVSNCESSVECLEVCTFAFC